MVESNKKLGFGKQRLISEIVKEAWGIANPFDVKFSYKDILYILQEMQENEGIKHLEKKTDNRGHNVFRDFVKYVLYRNLANYDSLLLFTSDKGTGKSNAAIMFARHWCNLLGIRFNPDRHLAYSNNDVMRKIDMLSNFEPLVADESVRFACLHPDTLIDTDKGSIKIKNLVDEKNIKVLSYNIEKDTYEYKEFEKCVKTKNDYVYEIETECGKKIKATKEHMFYTDNGWQPVSELQVTYKILNSHNKYETIMNIGEKEKIDVYDIINVQDNNNYVADNFVVHNSSADWNKKESKELRKKIAEIRTKHMLFILCFPLKIYKMEKTYLESFVNYWTDLFGRGIGAIYVKDKNPVNDSWRMKDFKLTGSYTEFTSLREVEKKLKKHPNFWKVVKFPKAPNWLYEKYLKVREKNVYNDEQVRDNVTTPDIHKALLILALQDVMMNDTTLNMNRIMLHLKNTYDIPITKNNIQNLLLDSKNLITKIREENIKK